ncbi:MAG TPA: penicillin-binding protein 2 [Candidatus Binataceae bacterium]|nr:penicillin-binding protein 2 [Candidatus Binataceae bacterium]
MAVLSRRRTKLAVPKLEPRLTLLSIFMMLVMGAVGLRLYYLQIIKTHQMADLADRNRIRVRRQPASRGLIFDRRHRILVDTRPSYDAVLVPEDLHNRAVTIGKLERFLGGDHVEDKISQAEDDGLPSSEPVTIKERLTWDQVVALETHQLEMPGVSIQVTPRRRYIYGPVAAHLLGYVGEVSEQELRKLPGYHMGDEIGKFGLERGWEDYLRGVSGNQEIEVDAVGRRLRVLNETPEKPGAAVVLTLDLDLQQAAEQALGNQTGALVAIDPRTGEILAMVSHPSFDPNQFATGLTSAQWRQLMSDPHHPLEDRVIQGTYPPGSTFKLVDTIAGLEERLLTKSTSFHCAGGIWYGNREYRCWRKQGHGTISLINAIIASCDVYFYNVGEHLGVDRLARWANRLGFGVVSGIPLAHERTGTIPSSAWKQRRFHERWYPAETLSVAIGQGYVAVTPLQLAQLAAEVSMGGIRYKPHFVRRIEALDGTTIKAYQPEVAARIPLTPDQFQILQKGACGVVNNPMGTARKAAIPGIEVCGKTGTAQVVKEAAGARTKEEDLPERYRDHGWFIAYAPGNDPRIAISCVIEHGGHGGSAAAPVVRQVMLRYFQLYPPGQPLPAGTLAKAAASVPENGD